MQESKSQKWRLNQGLSGIYSKGLTLVAQIRKSNLRVSFTVEREETIFRPYIEPCLQQKCKGHCMDGTMSQIAH